MQVAFNINFAKSGSVKGTGDRNGCQIREILAILVGLTAIFGLLVFISEGKFRVISLTAFLLVLVGVFILLINEIFE